jgi:integrase
VVEHEKRHTRNGKRPAWTVEIERMLKTDILPRIGALRAEAVTKVDVSEVVEKVANRGAYVVADHTLGLVRAVFNWANGTGRLEVNPTIGLKKRRASKPRERTLTDDEIRTLWRGLDGTPLCDAFRLQLLLGMRIAEVIAAPKTEIDLIKRLWVIPPDRTKSRRERVIPLSTWAVDILTKAMSRSEGVWLFPGNDGPIKPKSASRALGRFTDRLDGLTKKKKKEGTPKKLDFTSHDLRRTAATRLGDLGTSDELVERILGHAPTGVSRKHYNHAKHIEPMRQALDNWAEELQRLLKMTDHERSLLLDAHQQRVAIEML